MSGIERYGSDLGVPVFSYDYDSLYSFLKTDFVLFGAGNYCEAFMEYLGDIYMPKYIFDNNEKIQGSSINGIQIIKAKKTDYKVILTSSDVIIRNQLKGLGYRDCDMVHCGEKIT